MAYDPVLQGLLDELWFRMPAGVAAAELERRQSWLVREFQIAASGSHAALEQVAGSGTLAGAIDADRVTQQPLGPKTRLTGTAPHGVADAATRNVMAQWRTDHLRCPVIFQARSKAKKETTPWSVVEAQGFVFHDQYRNETPRVFVRDYTGRYPLVGGVAPLIPVGTSELFGSMWGMASRRGHSMDAEFTADRLTGQPFANLSASGRSTFRVLAALATIEADGVIDGINGYDQACLSAGPFHYTAFPGLTPFLGAGELAAFLAYLRQSPSSANAFSDLFERFGFAPLQTWGKALRDKNDQVFRAGLGFVNAAGSYAAPAAKADRDWIRTWHSFHRIQHALRSSRPVQNALWPYTRQRLSDLLNVPWTTDAPSGTTKLGDVFKSELSVALLARWHVYRPKHVADKGVAATVPVEVVKAAGLSDKALKDWQQADEDALIAGFSTAASGALASLASDDLRETLARLLIWRREDISEGAAGPSLRRARAFALLRDDIPFPPAKKARVAAKQSGRPSGRRAA